MKLLLIIDGERRELPVHAFEISYNKYEEFDTVIIIDTPAAIQAKIVEATDIRKPSSKGIVSWDPRTTETFKLSDLYTDNPKDNPLIAARIDNGVIVRDDVTILTDEEVVQHNVVISSDSFNEKGNIFNMLDLIPTVCNQLAEREKVAIGDHYLYIIEEPYLKIDEDDKYRIIEKISVVRHRSTVETSEQPEG